MSNDDNRLTGQFYCGLK